jgi:hypothetical protein
MCARPGKPGAGPGQARGWPRASSTRYQERVLVLVRGAKTLRACTVCHGAKSVYQYAVPRACTVCQERVQSVYGVPVSRYQCAVPRVRKTQASMMSDRNPGTALRVSTCRVSESDTVTLSLSQCAPRPGPVPGTDTRCCVHRIWKVGSCDITWYIPYWLVYTTFVISVVISVQSGVIYHEIWKHRRWNITWYITCDEEAHGCYRACYMPRNMVWYILELCL